ncbi:TonB-dependent receptor [Croceivirga sp. JEA036]|uniref:TonB-dependent receptor n=1 Tax=Croceivirga sp. JEA036 TaxID=2721162 RepID=UPI001FD78854|nr:TonB-dependent receptor [Croceivirga sp. JEA036]
MKMIKYIATLSALLFVFWSNAQEKEDNIGTETVTVVKPYAPSVSDAFKVKTAPKITDSIALKKKPITYHIFSVPVASTFTPAKAKAAKVERTPAPTLYNSYAAVGLGNYNNALVDFYTSRELGRDEKLLDVGLTHQSSRGDINSTPLETDFYNTDAVISLSKKDMDYDWGTGLELGHQLYNWYGLQSGVFTQDQVDSIDERQNYFNAGVNGFINVEDSFFKHAELAVNRFWDSQESAEIRANGAVTVELPITSEMVSITAKADYVTGSFENASLNSTTNEMGIDYGQLITGVSPSFMVYRDELTLKLGANFVYGLDMERSEGSFYIYPAVTASYRVMEDQVIAYGGIEGNLEQNTYKSLVANNPYVSPTLGIQPTDMQYNAYAGIKGQLVNNIGYNVRAFYKAENRKPLYLLNPLNSARSEEGYAYGNSFQVFYDDVKTVGAFAELNFDINRNFTLGINGEYNVYSTETDNPAWNLPKLKSTVFMDYQITDHWYAGANLFFVGEREDLQSIAAAGIPANEFEATRVTLDSYFDANAHLGYRFNDQLAVFAKFSNLSNKNYERWSTYYVQGFQALAGISYKFDF